MNWDWNNTIFLTADKMRELAKPMLKNQYGQYLLKVINELGLE